jgi:hypothetical protein
MCDRKFSDVTYDIHNVHERVLYIIYVCVCVCIGTAERDLCTETRVKQ